MENLWVINLLLGKEFIYQRSCKTERTGLDFNKLFFIVKFFMNVLQLFDNFKEVDRAHHHELLNDLNWISTLNKIALTLENLDEALFFLYLTSFARQNQEKL